LGGFEAGEDYVERILNRPTLRAGLIKELKKMKVNNIKIELDRLEAEKINQPSSK
jgi:hypothetical protein